MYTVLYFNSYYTWLYDTNVIISNYIYFFFYIENNYRKIHVSNGTSANFLNNVFKIK